MSHDTLFQLGMASVLLNASQKEEIVVVRAPSACAEVTCITSRRAGVSARAGAVLRTDKKSRSNSAKALILRAEPAFVPPAP